MFPAIFDDFKSKCKIGCDLQGKIGVENCDKKWKEKMFFWDILEFSIKYMEKIKKKSFKVFRKFLEENHVSVCEHFQCHLLIRLFLLSCSILSFNFQTQIEPIMFRNSWGISTFIFCFFILFLFCFFIFVFKCICNKYN